MDRFNFRVEIDGKVYPVYSILLPDQFQVIIDGEIKTYNIKDYKLMQCTCLKDCEDKDIYDGDIIQCEEPQESYTWSKYGYAVWNGEMFVFKGWYPDFPLTSPLKGVLNYSIYKIIGNIYQNPELLEATPCKQ